MGRHSFDKSPEGEGERPSKWHFLRKKEKGGSEGDGKDTTGDVEDSSTSPDSEEVKEPEED